MPEFPAFDPSRLTKKSAAAQYSSDSDDDDGGHGIIDPSDPTGDSFGDLNPRKRRRVGHTKESAALGIFGSDSEDDGRGANWKRKSLRAKGMNFVSTSAAPEEEKEYSDDSTAAGRNNGAEESDDDDDYDDDGPATAGLGFSRPGLGAASAGEDSNGAADKPLRPTFTKTKFDGRNPLGRGFVPSSARQPVLSQQDDAHEAPAPPPKPAAPSAFNAANGAKGKPNPKSFGARMMAKMGYVEGTGLGKEAQGRNVIIEAHLRPQGVGLGAVREKSEAERKEEKRQARLKGEVVMDSDEEEKRKKRERKKKFGSGATSTTSTPRRQKPSYVTAEELKKTAPGLHIPDAFAPILDLTGPGSKLLTSTSGILTPTSGAVPETSETAEARKLVRRAHADLAAFSEEWRNLEERKSWVDLELREREEEMNDITSDLSRLQRFADIVARDLPSLTEWADVARCLREAVEHIGTVSNQEVGDITVAAIHPFFRDPDWSLLEQPTRLASELQGLIPLLREGGGTSKALDKHAPSNGFSNADIFRQHHKATTPYETMMYKLWYPKAMTAVREWDVYDAGPLLAVLEAWNDLLPAFVRAQFVDGIVRKLESAVADWNPRRKRQAHQLPHLWLFPWLQHMPAYHLEPRGTGLVADVRRKFCQLVDVWEFERGVVPGLERWRDVLGAQWQPLIMSHVLPAMGRYLRNNFRVDPGDQEPYLGMLTGTLRWTSVLGAKTVGQVVVAEVFPLWHEKLSEWLGLEEMNLEEVYAWYEWWKDQVFPAEISSLRMVRDEFGKGGVTIERALANMEV